MKLAIIFLNKQEFLEDILTGFLEIGVSGATVVDSVGMGRIISYQVPIFAGLRSAFPESAPSNKTILTVVQDELVPHIAELVEDVCHGFEAPGSGLMITVPISDLYGFKEDIDPDGSG